MTLSLTSRCRDAARLRLLGIAVLCLDLLFAGGVSAVAQHRGGMAPQSGARRDSPRGDMLGGRSDRPMPQLQSQPHVGLQLGLGGRWWDDHKTVKKLRLRPDQQHRMDGLFEANKASLITLYSNLQREEINLASLSPADLQDESKVFAAIDRVSHARSDLEKENAHILLQIRQQLDPQQLETLDREIASLH